MTFDTTLNPSSQPVFASVRRSVEVATIANGASLSDAIHVGDAIAGMIEMPSGWTAADLTFQVSSNGETYRDFQDGGGEYTLNAAASQAILLSGADWIGVRYFKIRSGTSSVPVNQGAERSLSVVLVA